MGGTDIAAKVRDSVVRPMRSVATFATPKTDPPMTLMVPGLYTRHGGHVALGGSGANLTWPPMVPEPEPVKFPPLPIPMLLLVLELVQDKVCGSPSYKTA